MKSRLPRYCSSSAFSAEGLPWLGESWPERSFFESSPRVIGAWPGFWSDQAAAYPTSAVCWNAGVQCQGGPGTYDTCDPVNKGIDGSVGVPGAQAVLHPLDRYIDFVQQLEIDKQQVNPMQEVIVAAIAGVPAGYDSGMAEISYQDSADPTFQNDFGIGPGCTTANASAVPPVRIRELIEQSVPWGPGLYSICRADLDAVLSDIARALAYP